MGALPQGTFRPRLREDVRFVECPDGVYVHSSYGACTLRGAQAYAWLTRLAPALTGERTLLDLTAGLPDDKRTMIEQLVHTLAEQRFVVDVRPALAHELTEAEQLAYAAEIAFIGYALDSPGLRFERQRHDRLVLAGGGPVLEAVLESCVGVGCREILVICDDPDGLDRVVEAARRDPAQRVRFDPGRDLTTALAEADMLLQVSENVEELVAGSRAAADAGVVVGQCLIRPAEVWLTPMGSPHAESAWHRLAGLDGSGPPAADPADGHEPAAPDARPPLTHLRRRPQSRPAWDDDLLIGPVPAVVAAMLSLARFSYLTGLEPAQGETLTRIDLRTLDTTTHRFLPHPRATRRRGPDPSRREDPVTDLPARAAELVDARTGLIGLLDEQDLPQSPLSICLAVVSDPYGGGQTRSVYGWAEDRAEARQRCLLAALAVYGTLAIPPDAEETPGTDLRTMRPRAVPVSALRPTGGGAPTGLAAGLTWAGAVVAGLCAQAEVLLAEARPDGLRPVNLPDDPLVRQLVLAGERPEVHDATPLVGIPAYLWSVPGRPPLVSAGHTAQAALRAGVERLLLRWQHGVTWERSHIARWPDEESVTIDDVRRLATAFGRVPVAVALDHDPEAARLLPYAVQVVLCDD